MSITHKADDATAVVDLLDDALSGDDNREVDFLAVNADAAANGDETSRLWKG
jgi:hypothetical protein